MPITVTITDQSGAGRTGPAITLDGVDSRTTMRDLIRTRVRDEVARHNAKARRVDWEQQADKALDAFQRNGFFVLVAGRQVTDPDEVLELTPDTDIRFIRLIQLAGG